MKTSALKLLIEAFLIVFSVILAFWIDRKSQQWQDDDLKSLLMERMRADLQNDSINFSRYLMKRDYVEERLEKLIQYVNGMKVEQDSLVSLLKTVEWVFTFTPNNATYQSIVNAGQLSLFERDTLFQKVSRYYNVDQKKMTAFSEIYSTGITRFLDDFLNKNFDRRLFHDAYRSEAHPIDLKQFTSREFSNVLFSLRDFLINKPELTFYSDKLNELLKQIREVQKL